MSQRLFIAASCALLALAVPAAAQRAITRVTGGQGTAPIVALSGLNALMPAPGLSLSAPSLAAGLPMPGFATPALTLAAPVLAAAAVSVGARPALVTPALPASLRSAAAVDAPGSETHPNAAAPIAALRAAAHDEGGSGLAAERIFDGVNSAPAVSKEDVIGGGSTKQGALSAARQRGTVKRWNEVRGYGFIAPKDGGEAVYVIANDIDQPTADLKILKEGEEVEFELRQTPNGMIAVKVIPVRLLPAKAGGDLGSGRHFDGAGMRRPLVEGWQVDGKDYASTLKLVNQLPNSAAPLEATYRFAHSDTPLPPARAANTAVGFASGGAIGAVLATALFVFGSIVNEVTGGRGIGMSGLAIFTGVFGLGGAFMGAMIGWVESSKPGDERESISGRIYRHTTALGETLYFATERYGRKMLIDLGAYAFAKPIVDPTPPAPWPAWKRAAAGLAAGAALAVSQWIPLIQIFTLPLAGPAVGAEIGRALTAGTGIQGVWLGGSLGLLVPLAAFYSFYAVQSIGMLMSLGVFVGIFAAAGLVLGLIAANSVHSAVVLENARNPADQWWSAAKSE